MAREAPTVLMPLTDEDLKTLQPLIDQGFNCYRLQTGANNRLVVEKPNNTRRKARSIASPGKPQERDGE